MQGDKDQALICYEQVIKLQESGKWSARAILSEVMIRMTELDFYECFHLTQRAELSGIDTDSISHVVLFVEAVIELMKKKFTEGIHTLGEVSKKLSELKDASLK